MTAVIENSSSLTTQCLEFCQALERQGKDFKLSITIGSTFTFSLDSRVGKATLPKKVKQRKSPSTLKRNAKRREEFLAKKSTSSSVVTGLESYQKPLKQNEDFQCDQCDLIYVVYVYVYVYVYVVYTAFKGTLESTRTGIVTHSGERWKKCYHRLYASSLASNLRTHLKTIDKCNES
mgnify:CR=1 FL=1